MRDLSTLIPLLVFLLVCAGVAFRLRHTEQQPGFLAEYFIGGKSMGGAVLALTTIATYLSVSMFVGGPGLAWEYGFGWVYMATCQVTLLLLLYGVLGKKLALIGRKIGAITIIDVIRRRYNSDALATLAAIVVVLFFGAVMVAQFVGGAKLFEAVTGYSYLLGLIVFGGAAIVFTTVGGFRAVAITDALCGIAIIVGVAVLGYGILSAGGGYEAIMERIAHSNPELFTTDAGGAMPAGIYVTQWLILGVLALTLPQTALRTLGVRDSKALRHAVVIGTVVLGAVAIGTTLLGVLAHGVLPNSIEAYGGADNIIPLAIAVSLPPELAGICIVGPVAAAVSTTSSLLIASSSAIVKDIYLHHRTKRKRPVNHHRLQLASHALTLGMGLAVLFVALTPPTLVWWIDMFALGGLETAFAWVLLLGLFWKRANKYGALASMAGGTGAYCLSMAAGLTFMSLHQIVIGVTVSLVCMVVGSLATKPDTHPDLERVFFP